MIASRLLIFTTWALNPSISTLVGFPTLSIYAYLHFTIKKGRAEYAEYAELELISHYNAVMLDNLIFQAVQDA